MSSFPLLSLTLLFIFVTCSFGRYPKARYYLYDAGCPDELCLLSDDGTVPPDLWEDGGNIKVLLHGWNINPSQDAITILEEKFITPLARDFAKYNPQLNVIVVDWTHLSSAPLLLYPVAANNVEPAGIEIAYYLMQLMANGGFDDWADVHLLGLSLGAHVSGVIGHRIQQLNGGQKIGRITGMDPAGPLFTASNGRWPADMTKVLDYTDAEFVDIIHSNMGMGNILDPVKGLLGSNLQAAHLDFYPNGGKRQRYQCNRLTDLFGCSHHMSVAFYSLSLRHPTKYLACPCDSYNSYQLGLCNCDLNDGGVLLGEMIK